MSIESYLQLAAEVAISSEKEFMWRRHFSIGCVAIRKDGVIVKSPNGATRGPCRHVHAETKISKKLDYGATVFVCRVRRDGSFGMAKPCYDCQRCLKSRRVKKIYYTTQDGSIESMEL